MKLNSYLALIIILTLFSCKEEGEGGKNDIEGYIITQEVNASTLEVVDEYPAFEENVYIIYGDNGYHADVYITSIDGHYFFDNLYKGDYSIFVYSDCLDCDNGEETVFKYFELKNRRENFMVDTIYRTKYVN